MLSSKSTHTRLSCHKVEKQHPSYHYFALLPQATTVCRLEASSTARYRKLIMKNRSTHKTKVLRTTTHNTLCHQSQTSKPPTQRSHQRLHLKGQIHQIGNPPNQTNKHTTRCSHNKPEPKIRRQDPLVCVGSARNSP